MKAVLDCQIKLLAAMADIIKQKADELDAKDFDDRGGHSAVSDMFDVISSMSRGFNMLADDGVGT